MQKVVIVGGGAAGMLAAVFAARDGHEVTLLEQNEKLGKKLFITGKGRCNVTNACEVEELFDNVVTNSKFLYSAFYDFDNRACMDFFESLGVRLKVERGNRVFPASDHSSDIINSLAYEMRRLGVKLLLQTKLIDLIVEKESQDDACQRISGVICVSDGKKNKITCDRVILATGGASYPLTGASKVGMELAQKYGHKVTKLYPALVPLYIQETFCRDLMGLSLKNIEVTIMQGKKKLYQAFGEMLFTHYGVSGPVILSASSYITKKLENANLELFIDLKPALTLEQLDKRLIREFEENHNKQFKNSLNGLFPTRLIPVMIRLSQIPEEKKVCEIGKEERKAFAKLIKAMPLTIEKTSDFSEAIITQGGVNVKEVNPSTMESKLIKHLYFAGEMLDLDALTGGFNLQIAWSSAHLAATSLEE